MTEGAEKVEAAEVQEEDVAVEEGPAEEEQEAEAEEEPITFTVGDKTYTEASAVTQEVASIVHTKYALGSDLTGFDKELALALLEHHPDAAAKKGSGVSDIAVTLHPAFHNRCLMVVRTDGTTEDFSVGRCVDTIFNKTRSESKARRVLVPKAVLRFDLTLTAPEAEKKDGQPPSRTGVFMAVREALAQGLAEMEEGATPAATIDLDLSYEGTRKMQLVLMHSEERAHNAAEKLPGERAEAICAEIEKKCGWREIGRAACRERV